MRQKLTYNRKNFSIVEGTTHKIRFICDHESDLDLSKCKVMFVLLDGDRQIRKKTTLEGDVVIADIDATDSLGKQQFRTNVEHLVMLVKYITLRLAILM